MELNKIGWSDYFKENFRSYEAQGFSVGRVYLEHRGSFWLYTEQGETEARVSGKMLYRSETRTALPAVGDWVVIRFQETGKDAIIHDILPRKSRFSRKVAGKTAEEQIVAANIDTAMIVAGLDNDFNLRRIERYLIMIDAGGAKPVVVLNKSDLCDDIESKIEEVKSLAPNLEVVAISANRGVGLDELFEYLGEGETIALLGSSGVGKSTLTNKLLGVEKQAVRQVREHDSRGRHTTTSRELMILPGGGLLIDTPGIRELQLWSDGAETGNSFNDIESLAAQCRFSDCAHQDTPGCAIEHALADGQLDFDRWTSYQKIKKELEHIGERFDHRAQRMKKKNIRIITRQFNKNKKRWS